MHDVSLHPRASRLADGDDRRPHTFLAGDGGLELVAFGSGSDTGLTFLPRAQVMWCGPRWVPLDSPHPFRAEGLAGARAGDDGLTYLVYAAREPVDSVYYPQSRQVRLRGLGVTLSVGE